MAETTMTHGRVGARPDGLRGIAADWSSDQRAFKNVSWGKAMMWIFLLSDTFIFGCFLLSYMTARMSTRVPWPSPSEVFGLHVGGVSVPLLLIAIMTFVLISSSGTMAMAVMFGYRRDRSRTVALMLLTTPIFLPIAEHLGYSPIWFGIFLVRTMELGFVHPPLGLNIYVLQGVAKDLSLGTIFRGVIPFLVADFFHLAAIIAFPAMALWLPKMMGA